MKLTKLLVFMLLGTILLLSAVPAASIGTTMLGTVNGYVKTQNGDAVPSCTVQLWDSAGTTVKGTAMTDSNGYYSTKIATGTYQIRALKSDVGISPMSSISVPASPALTRDLTIPSIPRTILLSASKDSVTADKASYTFAWGEQTDAEVTEITATIKDAFGHPTGSNYHLNFSIDASPYDGKIDGRLGGGNMWYAAWRWSLVEGTTINNPTTFLYGLVSNKTKYTTIKVRVTAADDTTTYASNSININIVIPKDNTATPTAATVSGLVSTTYGQAISGATVQIWYQTNKTIVSEVKTDSTGHYTASVPAGQTYGMRAWRQDVGTSDDPTASTNVAPFTVMGTTTKDIQVRPYPYKIVAQADKTSINADGSDSVRIIATCYDVFDHNWGPPNGVVYGIWFIASDSSSGAGHFQESGTYKANITVSGSGTAVANFGRVAPSSSVTSQHIGIGFITEMTGVNLNIVRAGQPNVGNNTVVTVTAGPDLGSQGGTPIPPPVVEPSGSQPSGQQINDSSDTTPPATVATLAGTQGNGTDVFSSDVQVILLANDGNGGGVQLTRYSLDGANWSLYASPFTVSKDGINTVYYYSVDYANNTEATHVKPFTITRPVQFKLPCLNALALPLLSFGVLAFGVIRRKKGG